jgi:hypothetical protein
MGLCRGELRSISDAERAIFGIFSVSFDAFLPLVSCLKVGFLDTAPLSPGLPIVIFPKCFPPSCCYQCPMRQTPLRHDIYVPSHQADSPSIKYIACFTTGTSRKSLSQSSSP